MTPLLVAIRFREEGPACVRSGSICSEEVGGMWYEKELGRDTRCARAGEGKSKKYTLVFGERLNGMQKNIAIKSESLYKN